MKTLNILLSLIIGLLIISVMAFAIKEYRDGAFRFFNQVEPYCEDSGMELDEFTQKLKLRLDKREYLQARYLYAMSAECFDIGDIDIEETKMKDFFCKKSNPDDFEVSEKKRDEITKYCR